MKTQEINSTLKTRIGMAQYYTEQVAALKDWRVRSVHNRQLRQLARATVKGKGYLVMTADDAHYIDPAIEKDGSSRKQLYGLVWNGTWKKIRLVTF